MIQNVSSNVRKYSTFICKNALGDEFSVLYVNISFDNNNGITELGLYLISWSRYVLQIYWNFIKKPENSPSSLDTWVYSEGNIYTWQQSFCTGSSCNRSSDSWLQPGRLLSQDLTSDWTVPMRLNITHRYCQYDIRVLVNKYSSLTRVYLSSSVTVPFVCWTGRSLSRMSIENCSLFYWNGSCLGHRMYCVGTNRWC